MQPAWITLMLFTGCEESHQLIPFDFVEEGFESGRIFESAHKTHPGVMLFSSDFFGH
jgi:hypothetical protein